MTGRDGSRDAREALLDAALDIVAATGLAKLSLGDVAGRAGLSRQTLYRYFRDRDDLVAAVVLREEMAFVAALVEAGAGHPGIREALEAGITAFLEVARNHPLLDRLIATEPEALLPYLTTSRAPVVVALRPAITDMVASRLGNLPVARVHAFSDGMARLLVSYAVNPPEQPVEEVAAHLAAVVSGGLAAP